MNIKWKNITIVLLLILIFMANTYRIKVEKENRVLSDEIEQLNIETNELQDKIVDLKLEIVDRDTQILELQKKIDGY